MTIRHFAGLAAAGILFAACQSGSFKIIGRISGTADGETIYLTTDVYTDEPHPIDSTVVNKGWFTFKGIADSLRIAMVYSKSQPTQNAPLIIESGTIIADIGNSYDDTRVYGTFCNNKWQELNDSLLTIGRKINAIAQYVYSSDLNNEEQQEKMMEIKTLENEFTRIIRNTIEKNADNDFGKFVQEYYMIKAKR